MGGNSLLFQFKKLPENAFFKVLLGILSTNPKNLYLKTRECPLSYLNLKIHFKYYTKHLKAYNFNIKSLISIPSNKLITLSNLCKNAVKKLINVPRKVIKYKLTSKSEIMISIENIKKKLNCCCSIIFLYFCCALFNYRNYEE